MNGEIYHVYNRGAGKQCIFEDDADYERFMLLLYLMNSDQSIVLKNLMKKYQGRSLDIFQGEESNHALVDVMAYALMPNHVHLVLRQKKDNGITTFMKKAGTGFSMYFNTKHERSGVLFQGRFKSKHVDTDAYLKWILLYVHLNPLSLINTDWENGSVAHDVARAYLARYRFSSYMDYYGAIRPERRVLSSYEEVRNQLDSSSDVEAMLVEYGRTKDRPWYGALGV